MERNRPLTICRVSSMGRKRFIEYLAVLERVVIDAAAAVSGESAGGLSAKEART
jgi:hypothetical protein